MDKKTDRSITIMIPAYNEEKHLEKVVANVNKILKSLKKDYEIIIFDDYSTDKTPIIADKLKKKYSNVIIIHNKKNMGLGYNYRQGIKLAKKEYYCYIPGDIDKEISVIKNVLSKVGEADLIIPYISNQHDRQFIRKSISKSYVFLLNLLFGQKIRYYNGYLITNTKFLKNLSLESDSFATQSEIIIKLLKKGHSYLEVPYKTVPSNQTRLFKIKNIVGVISTIIKLFYNINIKKNYD